MWRHGRVLVTNQASFQFLLFPQRNEKPKVFEIKFTSYNGIWLRVFWRHNSLSVLYPKADLELWDGGQYCPSVGKVRAGSQGQALSASPESAVSKSRKLWQLEDNFHRWP